MGLLRRFRDARADRSGAASPDNSVLTAHATTGGAGPQGYYVYAHHDRAGQVFYIGKGTGDRAWSRERHVVWQRYVDQRLGGDYGVKILREGLTEDEALDLEDRLIREYGDQLVNWVNPGRKMDYEAISHYWAKRKESQRLTGIAKDLAKEDPAAAVPICRQALDLVHEYSQLILETGLVEELRKKNRNGDATVGDPNVIYRLALCLKRAGDLPGLVREVDAYFERYPDAASHSAGRSTMRLRDKTAAKLYGGTASTEEP